MREYFVFRTREEVATTEARMWNLVKDRFADNTERWAKIIMHPTGNAYAIILPEDWRDILPIPEQSPILANLKDQDYIDSNGWFPDEMA
jgi:hypothetical protein